MTAKPLPDAALKVRALKLLARREYSRVELRRKLLRDPTHALPHAADRAGPDGDPGEPRGRSEAVRVDALLDWLEQRGYLSAARFVESRIDARWARFGNRRIEAELMQHGLAPDREAAQALAATELQRAREVWSRKYGVLATDAAGRARQARFLTQRGFSSEVVVRVVRGAAFPERASTSDAPENPIPTQRACGSA